jgi:hypothetical protein
MPAMQNISHDLMFLVAELKRRRVPRVLGELAKLQGYKMPNLSEQERQVVRFITILDARLNLGNYRIAEAEIGRLRDAAAWAMAKIYEIKKRKAAIGGQIFKEKEPVLQWSGNEPPHEIHPPGTYSWVLTEVAKGTPEKATHAARQQ